jgi:Tfp pilus assembly protein PilV
MIEQTVNDNTLQTKSKERGVSILEVLISAVVISIGLVSIAGILAYVARMNTTSNQLNIQAAAAQDQIDRLRSAIWTKTTEDPTIAVGGSLPSIYTSSSEEGISGGAAIASGSETQSGAVGKVMASGTTQSYPYTYTLDTSDNHHADVSNTPVGNLRISWQVRQGLTEDLRYVTINVRQVDPSASMRNGFTVTTILSRN